MTFPLDRISLGPRSYGLRPRTEGVTFHTTEYPDSSVASAMSCIRAQSLGGSLHRGGGSYHFILTDEGPILSVPYLEASGGISGDHTPPSQISPRTNRPGTWLPSRFPWLREKLSAAAYADPNAYMLQIAVSGRTANLRSYPQRIIDDAARIVTWAEQQPEINDDLILNGHFNWQTDRSDPGQWFIDAVLERIGSTLPDTSTGGSLVIIQPGLNWQKRKYDFGPETYALFKPADDPNPANWTDRTELRGPTSATVSGPWRMTTSAFDGERLRIEDGFRAGYYIGSGPQPTPQNLPPPPSVDCTEAVKAAKAPLETQLTDARNISEQLSRLLSG